MTPNKVEEMVEQILESEPMKRLLSLESTAIVTGRASQYTGKTIQEVFREALTQYHQDLMAEIIKDVNQMWVDELSRKDREEGATAIGYSKVVAYLSKKV